MSAAVVAWLLVAASRSRGVVGGVWPERWNLTKQFEVLQEAGCSGFCALNGFGDGYVIGTAPLCDATCASDCPGHACISPLPGGEFLMPDAGGLCADTAAQMAKVVFKNESLPEKFKEIMMIKGKACCCESLVPWDKSETKDAPTPKGSVSCDDWCQDGGFGHGITIGTAPVCSGSCADDCAGNVCSMSNDFFSDHGGGCASGSKVCCCAAQNKWPDAADYWKHAQEAWNPPEPLPTPFSCADFCGSGGWGGGSVLGSAPFCGASCSDDCPGKKCVTVVSDTVTDYGKGCATGNKVCCCEKGEAASSLAESGVSISSHDFHGVAGLPPDADGAAFLQVPKAEL